MISTQPHTQCIPHAPHSVPAQSQPRVSWPKYAKQQDVLSGRQWWPHRSLMFRAEGPAPTQGRPRCSSVEESSPVPLVWEGLPMSYLVLSMSCSGGQTQERIRAGPARGVTCLGKPRL